MSEEKTESRLLTCGELVEAIAEEATAGNVEITSRMAAQFDATLAKLIEDKLQLLRPPAATRKKTPNIGPL